MDRFSLNQRKQEVFIEWKALIVLDLIFFRDLMWLNWSQEVTVVICLGHFQAIYFTTCVFGQDFSQVSSCELAIFATRSGCNDQSLVPATSPTISNQFKFLGQVHSTCSSKCFLWTVRGTSPCDQSLCLNSPCLAAARGEGVTPYNGLYGEALPERSTFFTLQVYKRVGISQVEELKRVGKLVI